MNRSIPIVLCALLGCLVTLAAAQDRHSFEVSPEEIVPAARDFRMSDRVLFVIDVSGSMRGDKIQQALASVDLIAGQGVDEFRVGALAFTGDTVRWEGEPECWCHEALEPCTSRCIPAGWAGMPGAYEALSAWTGSLAASGDTCASPALEAALHDPEARLTLVLVTDGVFPDNRERASLGIERGQAWRAENGLPQAPIMVWGVGEGRASAQLLEIARTGGGGMWVHGAGRSGPW